MFSDSEDDTHALYSSSRNHDRTPKKMYLLAALAAIGGFLFGYDTGVVSGAILLVRRDMDLSDLWHEIIVSGTIVAAILSSFFTGTLANRYGRRPAILLACLNFALGSLIMSFSVGKGVLLFGRILVGIGVGIASTTVPMYIGECSTPELRGTLVTLNILAVTFGQMIAGIVCGLLSKSDNGWRYMLGLATGPAIVQLLGFYLMPESPRFLVNQGKFGEAQQVLSSIRSPYHQIQDEMEDIKISCSDSKTVSMVEFLREFTKDRHAKLSVFLGCLLQFAQQFAGINTVMYYAASIIKLTGASDNLAIWFSAVTATINFMFTLVGIRLVQSLTRRRLLFLSLGSVSVSLVLISSSFMIMGDNMQHNASYTMPMEGKVHTENTSISGPILVLCALCVYIASFAIGMGPLPWTINSELHPVWCRAQAQSLATSTNWMSNLFVSLTFLSLLNFAGNVLTFFMYAGITFICGVVLYYKLPETKGVKLEDVGTLFDPNVSTQSSGPVVYTRLQQPDH